MAIPLFQVISGRNPKHPNTSFYSIPDYALPVRRSRVYDILGMDADIAVIRCCRAIASSPLQRAKIIRDGGVVIEHTARELHTHITTVVEGSAIGSIDTPVEWDVTTADHFFDEDTWVVEPVNNATVSLQEGNRKTIYTIPCKAEDSGEVYINTASAGLPFRIHLTRLLTEGEKLLFTAACPYDSYRGKAQSIIEAGYNDSLRYAGDDAAWISLNLPHEFVAAYLVGELLAEHD